MKHLETIFVGLPIFLIINLAVAACDDNKLSREPEPPIVEAPALDISRQVYGRRSRIQHRIQCLEPSNNNVKTHPVNIG
jgi:hypothetical protein